MNRRVLAVFVLLVGTVFPVVQAAAMDASGLLARMAPAGGTVTRVSVASDGTQGNEDAGYASISSDGRYVAFESSAGNLVAGDTNNTFDIFVHDRHTGETRRVSVASDGTQGNGPSTAPSISADAHFVAFESFASNLVAGDSGGYLDIFVHDLGTGKTSRVSVASDGTQGNDYSIRPFISADGRYVTFESYASNLVTGDTNSKYDIFVYDRQAGDTSRVSVASDGAQANGTSQAASISADGRYVVFRSWASNLIVGDTGDYADIFIHDRQTGETSRVTEMADMTSRPSISADGRYVAFDSYNYDLVPGDTNFSIDVFVYDRQTEETSRISVASDGTQGNHISRRPFISADGRYVVFHSDAANLVAGDSNGYGDIFVHDRQTKETRRISVAPDEGQSNGDSALAYITADGGYVVFQSDADNLIAGDTNGYEDVFVYECERTESEALIFMPFLTR